MRVGFIGDVVGRPGRAMLKEYVKLYKEKYNIDFVVANCENASGGFGLGAKNAMEIFDYGVDVITGGNHSFDKRDIIPLMNEFLILRPYNYYTKTPGVGVITIEKNELSLSVINLIGAMGLNLANNIFHCTDAAISECKSKNILVDLHSEMTSEKMAYFWEFKEKLTAVFGTHTHVGTDDLKIMEGCAYVSDVGLCGARDGVIGMDASASIEAFKTGLKKSFIVNEQYRRIFQMIVFDCYEGTTTTAFKVKVIDDKEFILEAYYD